MKIKVTIGDDNGLYYYEVTNEGFLKINDTSLEYLDSALEDGNSLWYVYGQGLVKNTNGAIETYYAITEDSTLAFLHSLVFDDERNIWLASDNGIYLFEQNTSSIRPVETAPITLHPNPTVTEINFDLNIDVPTTLVIYDNSGKKVDQKLLATNNYDVSQLPCGFYRINLHQKNRVYTSSFVKI